MNYKTKRNKSVTPCPYGETDSNDNVRMVGGKSCLNCFYNIGIDKKEHSVGCAMETRTIYETTIFPDW